MKSSSLKAWILEKDTAERSEAVENLRRQHEQSDKRDKSAESAVPDAADCDVESLEQAVKKPVIVGNPVLMTSDVFADVEMFQSYENGQRCGSDIDGDKNTVFKAIDLAHSAGSSMFLRSLIERPICDESTLMRRRRVVQKMKDRLDRPPSEQPSAFSIAPEETKRYEKDVIWAYTEQDDASSSLYDIAYFNTWLTRSLNGCPTALTALNLYRIAVSPLIGLLSPILYFVIPYLILRYKAADIRRVAGDLDLDVHIPTSFIDYLRYVYGSFVTSDSFMSAMPSSLRWVKYVSCALSLVFYFQAVFNSFEISRTLMIVSGVLNSKMTHIWRFFARAASVVKAYWDPDIQHAFFADVQGPDHFEEVSSLFSPEDETDELDFSKCGFAGLHIGEGLSRYKLFDHARFMKLLRAYYAVDAVLAPCRLLLQTRLRPLVNAADDAYTYSQINTNANTNVSSPPAYSLAQPRFDTRSGAAIYLKEAWHPCLDARSAQTNDIIIDRTQPHQEDYPNMLITGPNAGGKSTLIKTLVITALMSQSILVCPCSESRCSAFAFINSQINVPDLKGKRSLFEEEMFRARSNLEAVDKLFRRGECALVVIDEIFSSTNPIEGIAGAYSVGKHLGSFPNCATIISTHYAYLTRLSGEKSNGTRRVRIFRNYQMPVREIQGSSISFVYPYKLERGVCKQYIALELLKTHGFDASVIDEAIAVKKKLTQPFSLSSSAASPAAPRTTPPPPKSGEQKN